MSEPAITCMWCGQRILQSQVAEHDPCDNDPAHQSGGSISIGPDGTVTFKFGDLVGQGPYTSVRLCDHTGPKCPNCGGER